jgi:sugar lactone lactonase YvrE
MFYHATGDPRCRPCAYGFYCLPFSTSATSVPCPAGSFCPVYTDKGQGPLTNAQQCPAGSRSVAGLGSAAECAAAPAERCKVRTLAGGGRPSWWGSGGGAFRDGEGWQARFANPGALALSADGATLYVADKGNRRIRTVDTRTGVTATLAGNGGFNPDGCTDGAATTATFSEPMGLGLSPNGLLLYVADQECSLLRTVDTASGTVTRVAGKQGVKSKADGPAGDAAFNMLQAVAVAGDGAGNDVAYVVDRNNQAIRAYSLDSVGTAYEVRTLSGFGGFEPRGQDGPNASWYYPDGAAMGPAGSLFVADWFNNVLRNVSTSSGAATNLVGDWESFFGGSVDGVGGAARVKRPEGLFYAAGANALIFADTQSNKLRRVALDTLQTATIAGAGVSDAAPLDWHAASSTFDNPRGVAATPDGLVLFVADTNSHRIRVVNCTPGAAAAADAPLAEWPYSSLPCASRVGLVGGPCAMPLSEDAAGTPAPPGAGVLALTDGSSPPGDNSSFFATFVPAEDTCGIRGTLAVAGGSGVASLFLNEEPVPVDAATGEWATPHVTAFRGAAARVRVLRAPGANLAASPGGFSLSVTFQGYLCSVSASPCRRA